MEENLSGKIPLLQKIKYYLSGLFRKEEDDEYAQMTGNVKRFSKTYTDAHEAAALCKEALTVAKNRIDLTKAQNDLLLRINDLENFEKLTEEDITRLKNILSRYNAVSKERKQLKNQLNNMDRSVNFLSRYEDDIPEMLNEIAEAEKMQGMLRQDISYLEGEKTGLDYDRDKMKFGLTFIYRFSIALVIFYATVTFGMVVMYIFHGIPVFFYAMMLTISAIIFGTILIIFKRRMQYELVRNELMQKRAVELLNKKRIHYARHTNFLNFEYEKFKVKNSLMLKNNWSEYGYNKNISDRHKKITGIVYDAENDLDRFLRKKRINNSKSSIERITKILDVDNRNLLHREIEAEKNKIDNNLDTMDKRQETLWSKLVELRDRDKSKDKIISQILLKYLEDVEKLSSPPGKAENSL